MKLGPTISEFNSLKLSSGWDHPRVGDVIFIGSRFKGIVSTGQAVLRRNSDGFSHVALNFTGDVCIHSTPKNGAHFDAIRDIFYRKNRRLQFLVFRYKDFSSSDIIDIYDRIVNLVAPYFNKPYNFLIFVNPKFRFYIRKRSSDNTFCSELISNFYNSLGISTSSRPPASTLPADILNYFRDRPEIWCDVSDIYDKYLDDEQQLAEVGLRQQIQRNQIKDITFALKVRAEKNRISIKSIREDLNNSLKQRRELGTKNFSKENYKSARRKYINYNDVSRYSMSKEIQHDFFAKRGSYLRRFKKYRSKLD